MTNGITSFITNMVSEGQTILVVLAVLAVLVGAFLQVTGGREGLDKAKKWYIGAIAGLVIGLGAKPIVDLVRQNIMF